MPEIIVLVGIPCSGKSTRVDEILNLRLDWRNFAILSRDNLRMMTIEGKYSDYKFTKENEDYITSVYDEMYRFAVATKRNIILDNTHCKESYLNTEIKRKPEGYTLRFIFFDCPLWKAYYRNVWRYIRTGKWIPFEVIKNMKKNYDKIDKKKYNGIF